jgi:hypothetical protein
MFRAGAIAFAAMLFIAAAPIPETATLNQPAPSLSQANSQNKQGHAYGEQRPAKDNTDRTPTFVQIVSCPYHDRYTAQNPEQCEKEPSPDWWLIGLTAGLILVGLGQLYLFYVQLRIIKESLDDAKEAADVATTAAVASKDQAETLKKSLALTRKTTDRQLRAYVGIISSSARIDIKDLRVTLTVSNRGKTPAFNLHGWGLARACPQLEDSQ